MPDQTVRPTILVTGPGVAAELRSRYGASYDIVAADSVAGAGAALRDLATHGGTVALVLADRASGGDQVLDLARSLHPRARRGLLLTGDESRTNREEIGAAFLSRQVECLVPRPMGTPDERFHRNVVELLDEWWRLQLAPVGSVQIISRARSSRAHELQDLLERHNVRTTFQLGDSEGSLLVVLPDGRRLLDPSNVEVAAALGVPTTVGAGLYDVAIVGGGPAGLSAAVYAESEGLRTALIEPTAMGGQAGTSSMIRNYLGFPRGISGAELAARAFEQAILFGTEMIYGSAAVALRDEGDLKVVGLSDGSEVPARTVVVATGVSYRRLDLPSLEPFQGVGVFYGAAMTEAPGLGGKDAFVVGGGNSAGQAAVHLARFARLVTILVRSGSLAESMSAYLVDEIDGTPNIEVRYHSEVAAGAGGDDGRLARLDVRDNRTGAVTTAPAAGLFVLIGAAPFTDWLPREVERDRWGYIATGRPDGAPFESTLPGVFAVGDVRRDSIKRVASAAGEGAACVRQLHDHLHRRARSTSI